MHHTFRKSRVKYFCQKWIRQYSTDIYGLDIVDIYGLDLLPHFLVKQRSETKVFVDQTIFLIAIKK